MSNFEFDPVNDTTKTYILKAIKDGAREAERAGWPGFPETNLPAKVALNVNALISDGVIRRREVTKPRPTDPTRTITYTYLSLEK